MIEDSYEKALRFYGSRTEEEVIYKTTQRIGNHTVTTYKKRKKVKKKVKTIIFLYLSTFKSPAYERGNQC